MTRIVHSAGKFPHGPLTVMPFDIVIQYKEKWLWASKNDNNKLTIKSSDQNKIMTTIEYYENMQDQVKTVESKTQENGQKLLFGLFSGTIYAYYACLINCV